MAGGAADNNSSDGEDKGKSKGLRQGFLTETEHVVLEDIISLRERLKTDLQQCNRLRDAPIDEAAPYESRYEERRVLQRLRAAAELFGTQHPEAEVEVGSTVAIIDGRLGANFVDTEESGSGTGPLTSAVERLGPSPRELLSRLEALNHIAMLCSERAQYDESIKHLVDAKVLYASAIAPHAPPLEPPDGGSAQETAARLERAHTGTLFYLAQAYGHKGDQAQSAIHCHATLQRQLRYGGHEFEPYEWCRNAMQLATFYSAHKAFAVGEHCLHAADRVLADMPDTSRRDESGNLSEKYCELRANIHLAWAELCRLVIKVGRHASEESAPSQDSAPVAKDAVMPSAGAPASAPASAASPLTLDLQDSRLNFHAHLNDLPPVSPECASAGAVATFESARDVFKRAMVHVMYAKAFFKLDGFVSDHYACVNLESLLYGGLVLFEKDWKRARTMHKRRAALLESLFEVLNPKAYHSIHRQIAFDLGSIYGELVDLQLLRQSRGERSSDATKARDKVVPLVEKAAKYLQAFIDSFRNPEGVLPDRVEEHNEEVFISAHFSLARVYGKLETPETLRNSLLAYEFISDYSTKHSLGFMREEIAMAREMVDLLPTKINKVNLGLKI